MRWNCGGCVARRRAMDIESSQEVKLEKIIAISLSEEVMPSICSPWRCRRDRTWLTRWCVAWWGWRFGAERIKQKKGATQRWAWVAQMSFFKTIPICIHSLTLEWNWVNQKVAMMDCCLAIDWKVCWNEEATRETFVVANIWRRRRSP